MAKLVSLISTARHWRFSLCAWFVVLIVPLLGGHAQAQLCQMQCGNRCYNSPNPSVCETMCSNQCSANGGNQGGYSRAPSPVWQPRFAAFAATPDWEYYGVSTEYYNPRDAIKAAQVACEKVAKRACSRVAQTDGINIAFMIVNRNGKILSDWIKAGDTMADAVNPMLSYCHEHYPGAKCIIAYKHAGR